ncbi:hypothetical protein LC040_01300 [Bacillus tianshenii]|nr:hypothetical protein LC040_01300 [Bacillus tianshenii]
MKSSKTMELPVQPFLTKLGIGIAASYALWFIVAVASGEHVSHQIGGLIFGAIAVSLLFIFKQLGQKDSGKKLVNVILLLLAIGAIVMTFVAGSGGGH